MSEQPRSISKMNVLGMPPARLAALVFFGVGVMWAVLGVLIAAGGDVAYGSLYSVLVIVSWVFAYAFWGMDL